MFSPYLIVANAFIIETGSPPISTLIVVAV